MNDVASSDILDTLLTNAGTTVAVKLIQDKVASVADDNKLYTFDILVNNLTPINGTPADISSQDVTFTLNSVVTVADSGTW
jgi:ABC-type oligopeptide transport system substrate-binding subunit